MQMAKRAELLVVGSRGHGRIFGALLGSVSHYVAAHAACPVVVIKPVANRSGHTFRSGVTTRLARRKGASPEEIMESIWVAAEMRAGARTPIPQWPCTPWPMT